MSILNIPVNPIISSISNNPNGGNDYYCYMDDGHKIGDMYAAAALTGLLANPTNSVLGMEELAELAWDAAEALAKARDGRKIS